MGPKVKQGNLRAVTDVRVPENEPPAWQGSLDPQSGAWACCGLHIATVSRAWSRDTATHPVGTCCPAGSLQC